MNKVYVNYESNYFISPPPKEGDLVIGCLTRLKDQETKRRNKKSKQRGENKVRQSRMVFNYNPDLMAWYGEVNEIKQRGETQ